MLNSQVWINADQFKRLKKISIAWAYLLRWGFERGGYFKNKEYYIKNRNSCIVGNAQFRQGIHTADRQTRTTHEPHILKSYITSNSSCCADIIPVSWLQVMCSTGLSVI